MENISNSGKLEGWTRDEKYELLEALKEFGSHNIQQIKECVSTKTENEIRAALDFYRKKASSIPGKKRKKRERKQNNNNMPMIPLARWAKFLVESNGFEGLQTETAAALRLIAEFEEKPPIACTEKVDFRKLYNMLADALEGKPLAHDKYIMALFDKCIVETALTSKALIRSSAWFKHIIQSAVNPSGANVTLYGQLTQDNELLYLRHLTLQKNYNPLNIPETYLKFSTHTIGKSA